MFQKEGDHQERNKIVIVDRVCVFVRVHGVARMKQCARCELNDDIEERIENDLNTVFDFVLIRSLRPHRKCQGWIPARNCGVCPKLPVNNSLWEWHRGAPRNTDTQFGGSPSFVAEYKKFFRVRVVSDSELHTSYELYEVHHIVEHMMGGPAHGVNYVDGDYLQTLFSH